MITLNIHPILRARCITNPHQFLKDAGISRHSAELLLSNSKRSINLDHLETLCTLLLCEPYDLLNFTPTKGKVYPDNNQLLKLQQTEVQPIFQTIAGMSYEQIKQISQQIKLTVK